MITNSRTRTRAFGWFLLALWVGGLILAWQVWPVQAGPDLPPRNPPVQNENDDDDDDSGPSAPVGAYIVLQAGSAAPEAWAVVQWQDSSGGWQEVEGWRGPLSSHNLWWVAAKDFGSGPFRWVILNGPQGQVLAASSPFDLPRQPNDRLVVPVTGVQ